ncbi:unnamed protein product [Linum trigynum]|uniref:3-ketoacyl-CoA synthase n=1 Tax=Linum trigynum TaxID=586398 RepID=A0AAV2FG20_9ROSI
MNPEQLLHQLQHFPLFTTHQLIILATAASFFLYHTYRRRVAGFYLLDFSCYRPSPGHRAPMAFYHERLHLENIHPDATSFQLKILEKSGFGEQTGIPESLARTPIQNGVSFSTEEASTIMFQVVSNLLKRTDTNPKGIDLLICNSSMFAPTPSLSSMVVSKFRMRSNIKTYNLSGMGCSAGIISVGLARDLLKVNPGSLALIVSTEMLGLNWYTGENKSMLLTNCLFRMGGAAVLMSNKKQDQGISKYELQHLVRTHRGKDDNSYSCVFQDVDEDKKLGVSISKEILQVAGGALKANVASLGPMVLPYSEQLCYLVSLTGRKGSIYVPNFKRAFQHFCIHAGGKAVIQAIQKNLKLNDEDVEPSKMTLYRFGNTSSSSIWYELSYVEAKGKMQKGDHVWQITFGSGFKCCSAVWKCNQSRVITRDNAWVDDIHLYPVAIPATAKISES